tara:strand:- start:599 stop:889 length:291 start_codon:yes stop_codon:yes gene_type:complete
MKITKSQLKQIIKEEIGKVLVEQEEEDNFWPRPSYTEDIPEWYKGPGGVAEQLNTMRVLIHGEVKRLETRIAALEPALAPKPEPGPAVATGEAPPQ